MASKRIGILAGGALAGALILGTAGFALAQDPSPSATANPATGPGMMGGQNGAGMMGGQNGAGMMGGQNGAGMMGGQNGAGMMGSAGMTPDQLAKMGALHAQMVASGTCDPAKMLQLHTPATSGN